jgi:hypothetical protein
VEAVHAKGSFIYLQLWALGRQAVPQILAAEGSYPYISASDVPLKGKDTAPRPLTESGMFTWAHMAVISDAHGLLSLHRNQGVRSAVCYSRLQCGR